jgi:hypothetical protein
VKVVPNTNWYFDKCVDISAPYSTSVRYRSTCMSSFEYMFANNIANNMQVNTANTCPFYSRVKA